ncbi:unnamed protein product [Periconia digitata]|uniref:Uncharacterized protein n=1 Tax=Periconia digitata TaxID=1303443 RepID=A0A9W4XR46_9PLEO|nr:unnamed protein product [Periconia digitata]
MQPSCRTSQFATHASPTHHHPAPSASDKSLSLSGAFLGRIQAPYTNQESDRSKIRGRASPGASALVWRNSSRRPHTQTTPSVVPS